MKTSRLDWVQKKWSSALHLQFLHFTFACALLVLATSCGVNGQLISGIQGINGTSSTSSDKFIGQAPAIAIQTTTGNYKITATVGESGAAVTTVSAEGMVLYSNVAGNLY